MNAPRFRIFGDQILPVDAAGNPIAPIAGEGLACRIDSNGKITTLSERTAQKQRKHSGDETEHLVESLHTICLAQGVARIRKLPTPYKIVGTNPDGSLKAVPDKKSGVDYVGTMLDGTARSVYAEVKRCKEGRFPLSRIEPHQRAELDAGLAAGAVSVIVIVLGELLATASVHAVPWTDVQAWIAESEKADAERGSKSITTEQLAPYRISRLEPYLARFARTGTP